jgi:aminoglycoside 6'-N-acetyltransferase
MRPRRNEGGSVAVDGASPGARTGVNPGPLPPELSFRPLKRSDLPLLAEWLRRPHVAQWWRESSDLPAVEAAYGPIIDGSDPTEGFIAVGQGPEQEDGQQGEGHSLAFLQLYRLDDNPEWQRAIAVALAEGDLEVIGPSAGIDYLIGDRTMTGRGLGRTMIAAFVDLVWDRYPDTSAVIVAVDQGNEASWRALEGAGFLRAWAGVLSSEDPSDEGPSYLYVTRRPVG